MDEAQGISFSLWVDPYTKRTFVRDVERTVGDAAQVAEKAGRKIRPLGEIFTGRSLLQLAAAAYALRRLGMAADEPSAKLKEANRQAKELAGTIGTELQAAAGEMAAGMLPAIKAILDLGAGVRGALFGGTAFLYFMPKIAHMLRNLGLAVSPWIAPMAAGFLLLGAAVQAMGARAAATERRNRQFAASLKDLPLEELQAKLRANEEQLRAWEEELLDAVAAGSRMAAGIGANIDTENARTRRLRETTDALHANNQALREQINHLMEVAKLERLPAPPPLVETASEQIARLNTEIALGRTTLEQAREEIRLRRERNEVEERAVKTGAFEILDLRTGKTRNLLLAEEQARLQEITSERMKAFEQAKAEEDIGKRLTMELDAQAKFERERLGLSAAIAKRISGDRQAGLQAEADLTGRIGQQNEKLRSEARHRLQLQGQILDLVRQEAPLNEYLVLQAEHRRMMAEGHRQDEIQMLELQKEISTLNDRLIAQEDERRRTQAEITDEAVKQKQEWDRMLESAEFAMRAMDVNLQRLAAASDREFREARMRQIQKELAIQDLSTQSLREAYEVIQQLKLAFPEMGAEQEKTFNELLGHLDAVKSEAEKIPEELLPLTHGLEQLTRRGSLAFTQLFTRGKVDAKRFAEDLLTIFEQMIAEMLGKAVFQELLALILAIFDPSGAAGAAAAGARAAAGGARAQGGMRGRTLGGTPNIPWPVPAGNVVNVQLRGIERRLQKMTERIEDALRAPVTATEIGLRGSTIRVALSRETEAAKGRKL